MTVTPTDANDAAPRSEQLADSLELWRDADRTADTEVLVPTFRVLEAHRLVVEQAKGALMLRYGIDCHQAFAVMVRWARVTHLPVVGLAEALVHGVCEGSPRSERRQGALLRWLEQQLLHDTPDPALRLTAARVRPVA
jgi:hypothetical protein